MLRNVIIVSPYFPPSSVAGVHRARHLAKHLPEAGWHPIIVCVHEQHHQQALDPALAAMVPSGVEIVKVPALSTELCRAVGLGDLSLRAWFGLRHAVYRLAKERQVSVVLITGGPFYPLTLASSLRRDFGIPVVLDFQDPWVSNWGAAQPMISKAGLAHHLAVKLEPRALRGASYVTSVSEAHLIDVRTRNPWLDVARMAAVPIGGDVEDFDFLRRMSTPVPAGALDPHRVNLSFVGTFMPRSGPLVRLVLQALALLRDIAPEVGHRIRLNFIGTGNQPGIASPYRVMPIATEIGVADATFEIPQRLPFMDALAVLARTDGVLLLGSDEAHYTASKIYPGMMSGRPFLSLFHPASSSHQILSACGGGVSHAYAEGGDHGELIAALADSMSQFVLQPDRLGRVDPRSYAPYEARAIAARFGTIFDTLDHELHAAAKAELRGL